jgi:hypothetical protein
LEVSKLYWPQKNGWIQTHQWLSSFILLELAVVMVLTSRFHGKL